MAKRLPQQALESVERLSRRIADPSSYLQGRAVGCPILPTNIICFVRRQADALAMHLRLRTQHHRFVLIVALNGSGQICIDAEDFELSPGQAQLIFPFQFHSYLSVRPVRINWVFLTFEMENAADLESLRSSPSRDMGPEELALLTEIIHDWNSPRSEHFLQHRLAMLLGCLCLHKVVKRMDQSGRRMYPSGNVLSEINRHLMAQPDQPMVLKTVAACLGQSESHLRRRFRLATGYSLGNYLRELRLQRACRLLHDTSLSVGEIAQRCGFDSIYSFSRAFKTTIHLSPRAYRQGLR